MAEYPPKKFLPPQGDSVVKTVFAKYLEESRFVEWDYVKSKKKPLIPGTTKGADDTNPATWRPYIECNPSKTGIVLNGDGLSGKDLDGCRDPKTGTIADWAMEVIRYTNSYTEISPSGTGVKIFLIIGANDPTPFKNICKMPGEPKWSPDDKKWKEPAIEMYSIGRYFTITGRHLEGTPLTINESKNAWTRTASLVAAHSAANKAKSGVEEYAGRDDYVNKILFEARRFEGASDDEIEQLAHSICTREGFAKVGLDYDSPEEWTERDTKAKIKNVINNVPIGDPGPNGELARMNKKYTVLRNEGGKCVVLTWKRAERDPNIWEPTYQQKKDFIEAHANKFIKTVQKKDGKKVDVRLPQGKWWWENPGRLEYERLIYTPPIKGVLKGAVIDDCLNLWRGFGVTPREGDWSLLQDFVHEVIAYGKQDRYEYTLNWLAHSIQYPDRPGKTALILKSKQQQVGKTTLGFIMCKLLGHHGQHINDARHITGRWNELLHCTSFLCADECFLGDDESKRMLKVLLTNLTFQMERKFMGPVTVRNNLHTMIVTNEELVALIEKLDARHVVWDVNPKYLGKMAYWKHLYDWLENGGYEAVLYGLLHRDISNWDPMVDLVDSEARQRMIRLSDDSVELKESLESQVEEALADLEQRRGKLQELREKKGGPEISLPTGKGVMVKTECLRRVLGFRDHEIEDKEDRVRFSTALEEVGFQSKKMKFDPGRHAKTKNVYIKGKAPYIRLIAKGVESGISNREVWRLGVALAENEPVFGGNGPQEF